MGASIAAGLLLGAGSYAALWADPPSDYRNFLILSGCAAAGFFAFRMTSGKSVVLVGDAGVATEQGGDVSRLLWSEIEAIRYEDDHLVLVGASNKLRIPSQSHTRAIRAVLAETAERLPKVLEVSKKLVDTLPKTSGEGPSPVRVESLQIAGKRCLVSKQVLTFERDARLCPTCTSIYHREHVPETCVTCERPLGKEAIGIEG